MFPGYTRWYAERRRTTALSWKARASRRIGPKRVKVLQLSAQMDFCCVARADLHEDVRVREEILCKILSTQSAVV